MLVNIDSSVSFEVDKPNEYRKSMQFAKDNPDWQMHVTTKLVTFKHSTRQVIEIEEDCTDDGCRENTNQA